MSLPKGITPRVLEVLDLQVYLIESGVQRSTPKPLILLVHGFPELSYSWRKVIVPLAEAGFHVVAPDMRGYGQTRPISSSDTPTVVTYDDDLDPYRMINVVKDMVALVYALGYSEVHCVVGHDFGSPVAGWCALIRPDLFKGYVGMSSPFSSPSLPPAGGPGKPLGETVKEQLLQLDPPRKHYVLHYSTREANEDLHHPPQGLHAFLRGYYHAKSADNTEGTPPHPLPSMERSSFAVLPHYYVMPAGSSMADVAEHYMPPQEVISSNTWLPDAELAFYVSEYQRTGFQGGLNHYRCSALTDPKWTADLQVFAKKRFSVPVSFISGKKDWGVYQFPGAIQVLKEQMDEEEFVLVEGAGHWLQQEKPAELVSHLLRFFAKLQRSN